MTPLETITRLNELPNDTKLYIIDNLGFLLHNCLFSR
jgi:hypothetical protein